MADHESQRLIPAAHEDEASAISPEIAAANIEQLWDFEDAMRARNPDRLNALTLDEVAEEFKHRNSPDLVAIVAKHDAAIYDRMSEREKSYKGMVAASQNAAAQAKPWTPDDDFSTVPKSLQPGQPESHAEKVMRLQAEIYATYRDNLKRDNPDRYKAMTPKEIALEAAAYGTPGYNATVANTDAGIAARRSAKPLEAKEAGLQKDRHTPATPKPLQAIKKAIAAKPFAERAKDLFAQFRSLTSNLPLRPVEVAAQHVTRATEHVRDRMR